jgi:hypothetical protein
MEEADHEFILQFVNQYNVGNISWTLELFLQEYLKNKESRPKDAHAIAAMQLELIARRNSGLKR